MPAAKMDKLDLYKLHKAEYAAPKKPAIVETKGARYLAVAGQGTPGGDMFQQRIAALYGMAYTLKFAGKAAGRDFTVCKLEALWDLDVKPSDDCEWKMLIRVPDFIEDKDLDDARSALEDRGKEGDFEHVQLETIDEGPCVQMLHVGPYEEEERTIEIMNAFAAEQGRQRHRWHHEIYLSDPRRVPAEKLKTILRQPVK